MEQNNKKALIIGLDGATWDLLKPWAESGKLPVFKKLMENGVHGTLKSTIPPHTCPAMPSIYTGKNSDKIGVFGFHKQDGNLVSFKDINSQTIWDLLGENGYKSFISYMKTTYPPGNINGAIIADFGSVYPKELQKEVEELSQVQEEFRNAKKLKREDIYNWRLRVMRTKYKVFKRIYGDREFDFAILWLSSTDWIQHNYWDEKETIFKFYQQAENILEDILSNYEGNIFIISDHGFKASPDWVFNLNRWLREEGYLQMKIRNKLITFLADKVIERPFLRNLILTLLNTRRRKFKQEKRQAKASSIKQPSLNMADSIIDWENSLAYAFHHMNLDIKLKGVKMARREKLGDDYEKLRNEIISKLKNLEDGNGNKVMENVWKREEIFTHNLDSMPDIIFQETEKFKASPSPFGSEFLKAKRKHIHGEHAMDGIFIACGPDIKRGSEIKGAKIYDITPTILHLMDIAIPEDMDGEVLKEIFQEESEPACRPIEYQEVKEGQRVKNKLRNLKASGRI